MGVDKGLVKPYGPALVQLCMVLDLGWMAASLWVAAAMEGVAWDGVHSGLAVLAIAIFWLSAAWLRLYRSWRVSPLRVEIVLLAVCWAYAALGVVFVVYAFRLLDDQAHRVPLIWFGLGFASLAITRTVIRVFLRVLRLQGHNFRTVAIAGATAIGQRIERNIAHTAWVGLHCVGFFDDRSASEGQRVVADAKVVGDFSNLVERVREGEIDVVYVALPLQSELRIRELLEKLRDSNASVYFVPDFSSFDLLSAHWDSLGDLPVVSIVGSPLYGMNAALKRASDVVLSLLVLALAALPMVAVAIAVKLTSKGPAIYRQHRYGLDGREFEIWKFRTMRVTESRADFSQAVRNDPRVTPIGAFLRRTSIDELPQLINVLQGRMSIVGPRPHPVSLTERHRLLVNRYMWRHKVKPGITGWAQVNGYRGETDTMEKIEGRIALDLEYINQWSLWMDLRILLRTVQVVAKGENAY